MTYAIHTQTLTTIPGDTVSYRTESYAQAAEIVADIARVNRMPHHYVGGTHVIGYCDNRKCGGHEIARLYDLTVTASRFGYGYATADGQVFDNRAAAESHVFRNLA